MTPTLRYRQIVQMVLGTPLTFNKIRRKLCNPSFMSWGVVRI